MKRGWIGLAAVLLAAGCSNKDTIDPGTWNSYRNPVEQSDVQDPAVYYEDGTFYLFATGAGETIMPMMVSTDLTGWELAISVFNEDTQPSFISGTIPQSPEITKVGDKYLLYYTLFKTAENCGVGVAVADLVSGPYTDKGAVATASGLGVSGVASPSYIETEDARYLVFGCFEGIYLLKLSDDGLTPAAGAQPVKIASEIFDAPYIKEKDGKFYLFASEGTTLGGATCLCQQVVGRADRIEGPYFDKSSKSMSDGGYEVVMRGSTKFTGPGHGYIFDAPDGNTWILYNAYDLSDVAKGRTLMLDRVNWQDGWPVVRGTIGSFCADAPALN